MRVNLSFHLAYGGVERKYGRVERNSLHPVYEVFLAMYHSL